jgi:hypothetical protein
MRSTSADANTAGANGFAVNSMNAGLQGAGMSYNAATEEENRRLLEEQERKKRAAAKNHATGQMLGTVAGGVAGGSLWRPHGCGCGL